MSFVERSTALMGLFIGCCFALITVACLSVKAQPRPIPPPPYAALPITGHGVYNNTIYRMVDPQFKVVCYAHVGNAISCLKYE
jgi:hypothetical protein